jgi:putative nucleotidyltransferase with HDIG domain
MTAGPDLVRRNLRAVTVFNFATLTLAGTLALTAFRIVAGVGPGGSSGWWALAAGLLAGCVYYACNEPLMALAWAFEVDRPFAAAFRERHAWLLPHYAVQGLLGCGLVLGARALGPLGIALFSMPAVMGTIASSQYVRRTQRMVGELRAANVSLERLLGENRQLLASLGRQHLATIRGLARAIDAKDPYTAGHTERVAQYAVLLARELGLPAELQRQIEHGSLLHDIGKIGVPDHVLSKTTTLNADDWQAMRRHPEIACYILDGIDLPPAVIDIVRSHHENLDGSGYPDGLMADQLSLAARIGRVADAFDAMTSIRPYRAALSIADARVELRCCAGSQFCSDVVAAMQRLIDAGQVDAVVPPPMELERTA